MMCKICKKPLNTQEVATYRDLCEDCWVPNGSVKSGKSCIRRTNSRDRTLARIDGQSKG